MSLYAVVLIVRPVLTSLAPPLLGPVDVVLELDADLSLVGQVSDEGVFEELLGARPLTVALHQTAVDERLELLRPGQTPVTYVTFILSVFWHFWKLTLEKFKL